MGNSASTSQNNQPVADLTKEFDLINLEHASKILDSRLANRTFDDPAIAYDMRARRKLAREALKRKLKERTPPDEIVQRNIAPNYFWMKTQEEIRQDRRKKIKQYKKELEQRLHKDRRPTVQDLVAKHIISADQAKWMKSTVMDLTTQPPAPAVGIQQYEKKFNEDNNTEDEEDEDENERVEKQFKLFLKKSKTIRYFDKFVENECCNMESIRYFDDEFLSQDIGMKSKILRKTFLRQCNKVVQKMDAFENNYGITEVLYEQLEKYGVVTISILCQQTRTRNDLKTKLKITNDYHCDLLWKIIQKENGDGAVFAKKDDGDQQEGANPTAWI